MRELTDGRADERRDARNAWDARYVANAVANEYERQVARQHRATSATPEADSASESEFILSSESDAE